MFESIAKINYVKYVHTYKMYRLKGATTLFFVFIFLIMSTAVAVVLICSSKQKKHLPLRFHTGGFLVVC